VERLNLAEAYARYGAQLENKLRGLSAVATDGAVILTCESSRLGRPGLGVLRFEGQIQAETPVPRTTTLLGEHLTLARDGQRPLRMVIVTPSTGRTKRSIHVRQDLIGAVTSFDGDHYVVDFTRLPQPPRENKVRRKR
jgi:hypothetical protein